MGEGSCKATRQAIEEQEATGEMGCSVCGKPASAHTCEQCDGDGYIDVMDPNHYGAVIGAAPCPAGCPTPKGLLGA